jgi:Uma2 family endonuclease
MSTATPPAPAQVTAPATPDAPDWADLGVIMLHNPPGRVVTVSPVDWAEYARLLAVRGAHDRPGIRLAYDGGRLEIMTVGYPHEKFKKILSLMLEVWIGEAGGDCLTRGNFTIRREDIERGFEPDECFYIQNMARIAGAPVLDFTVHPPPDVVVEIEVSRAVDVRLPIYAAFRVPEVWRYDGQRLLILLLQPDGTYRESTTSAAVPTLRLPEFTGYLNAEVAVDTGNLTLRRQFAAWIRSLPPAPNA